MIFTLSFRIHCNIEFACSIVLSKRCVKLAAYYSKNSRSQRLNLYKIRPWRDQLDGAHEAEIETEANSKDHDS